MTTRRNCPHCGKSVSGYNRNRDTRALELGVCVDCGADKTDEEIARGAWRCAVCRKRRNAHAARVRYRGINVNGRVNVSRVQPATGTR